MTDTSLSLQQIDYLIDTLRRYPWYKERYTTDYDQMYEVLDKITQGQKSYIYLLVGKRRISDLEKMLYQIKMPHLT